MNKQIIFISWVCFLLFSLLGCMDKQEKLLSPVISQQQLKPLHWDLVYGTEYIESIINTELKDWIEASEGISFIIEQQRGQKRYHGFFEGMDHWEIKGIEENAPFQLEVHQKQAILSFADNKEEFLAEEIYFLLPAHHLVLLSNMLEEKSYELLEWTEEQHIAWIELSGSMENWEGLLKGFLEAHYKDEQIIDKMELERYTFNYRIEIDFESKEHAYLKAITFYLQKDHQALEELTFHF